VQTIKLAVTNGFFEKQNLTNRQRAYGHDFISVTFSPAELIEWIVSGKTLCVADVKTGHRCKANFSSSQLIGIDIDSGDIRSIEALLRIAFVSNYAFFVGPSASSTPENPRSRIYFVLAAPIEDSKFYERYVLKLSYALQQAGVEVDTACKDCTRMYHGSTQSGYWQCLDNVLPIAVLEALPEPPQKAKSPSTTTQAEAPVLSAEELSELEQKIRIALRYLPKWGDYQEDWLNIIMAVWDVFPNEQGIALLEEWSAGYPGEIAAKFATFTRDYEQRVTINTLWYRASANGWTENTTICPDMLLNTRYISNAMDELTKLDGVILIRSDMDTGKTTFVEQQIKHLERKLGRPVRVLVVSHRKSLIANLAKRFDFQSYEGLHSDQMRQAEKLICTANSLHKLLYPELPQYDVIIIDEIEQVLMHFIGKTLRGKAVKPYCILCHFILNAECVIGLDAHATETAYRYFKDIRDDVHFIVNTYRQMRGKMNIIAEEESWLTRLIDRIEQANKPIVVACDSRKKVEHLADLLEQQGIHNIKKIHSGNSSSLENQAFLTNINDELPKYQVILHSPTIGTGVDIKADVDSVFGCFTSGKLTAEEQHQMLGRCREAKTFFVYFKHIKHDLPTDADNIYTRHYENLIRTSDSCELDFAGKPETTVSQERFLRFASRITAARNYNMNHASRRFRQLADTNFVVEEMMYAGSDQCERLKAIQEQRAEQMKALILTARPVDQQAYEAYKNAGAITDEIEAGYTRWSIEDFFGEPITPELSAMWDKGNLKTRLFQFIDLYRSRDAIIALDRKEHDADVEWMSRHHHVQRSDAFHDLLSTMFDSDGLLDKTCEADFNLKLNGEFAEQVRKHEPTIYNVMGRRKPKGKADELYNILRWLLKQIGLSLEIKREGKKHDKQRFFALDAIRFTEMCTFARSYIQRKQLNVDMDKPTFNKNT